VVTTDFSEVTERSGEPASPGQIADTHHRYRWASAFSAGRRVLEVACGTGQGLGLLARDASSVAGCDIDPASVARARRTYGERFAITEASAERLPVADRAVDVVLLFEALYYLPDPDAFLRECRRVLPAGGTLLLTTNNRDLFDFAPSPLSRRYYGAAELPELLARHGFDAELFGYARVEALPLRHRLLRPAKATARRLGLVPKTMRGKAILRRLLFGKLPPMPDDVSTVEAPFTPPEAIPASPNRTHRFLYVSAKRRA
jgi:SAM-dependent methyltransferase